MKHSTMMTICFVALSAVALAVLVGSAVWLVGASNAPQAVNLPIPAQPEGKHMLEWAVMAFAVGQVAGLVGSALHSMRTSKRAGKPQAAAGEPLPMYEKYRRPVLAEQRVSAARDGRVA